MHPKTTRRRQDVKALAWGILWFLAFAFAAHCLTSCTTARPLPAAAPVGVHDYSHNNRTKHTEPYATPR